MRDFCNSTIRDGEMARGQDRVTGDYNDFWAGRDLWNEIDGIQAATLWAHGLNDWNVMPEHSVHIFENLKERGVPTAIFLHQGGHGGGPPLEMRNRWFTRFLYDVDNGVEDDMRAWVVREGDDRSAPTGYADYPNPAAEVVSLRPGGGGAGVGQLGLGDETGGIEGFVDDVSLTGGELAALDASAARLVYATPTLTQPVHLSGTPRLSIRLASDAAAPNLSVWLVSLPWNAEGTVNANIINRGWADPQNADSWRESRPLEPGQFVELTFDLQPDDQIIPAGQRIGLMIFGSDREFTLWATPGTAIEVDLAGTLLELPVVGGAAALAGALGGDG
jgi:X-Pro dipeptidyl-peptidase